MTAPGGASSDFLTSTFGLGVVVRVSPVDGVVFNEASRFSTTCSFCCCGRIASLPDAVEKFCGALCCASCSNSLYILGTAAALYSGPESVTSADCLGAFAAIV